MSNPVQDKLISSIQDAGGLYHRLVLLVGLSGSGKTRVLRDLAKILDTRVININLELCAELLELTQKKRALRLAQILDQITSGDESPFILDNIEVLFDKSLEQDPLRLLQSMSRNKTILTSWNGQISGKKLVYAHPGHPEYQSYNLEGLVWVSMQ